MAGDALREGPMRFDIVTIFPAMVAGGLTEGVVARGIGRGAVDVRIWDLRDQTTDRHRSVDDMPYGGGPGMVMTAPVWGAALDEICSGETLLVVPTPAEPKLSLPELALA